MPTPRARPRPREGRGGGAAGCASGPAFSVRRRREMAAGPPERRDARVRCCSRRGLDEVVGLCAPFLRDLARGQPGGAAAEDDAIWNFEAAVRENVTINGQPWAETSADSEPNSANIKILEDQLDELIVETATKRKQWPKKILVHAIQTMKAEQEMLKLYQPVVTPEEIKSQPSQDAYIADLKQVTEMASEQIGEAMKSLPALIERAEGFSQALTWQPTLELCKLRQEVFTGCNAKEENSVQNFVSPAEVTPTDADTTNNPYTLFKRKKAADTPQRRYYPLRRRKITLST
ncbi:kinetochore-associated protein NSL1 homolog isoform X2 [Phasianus colchicus]|uniref:kinetochore-associated protein NSL1 homolog isoform X2 n=1 Tax=Phasianus colchicus TaxID=9054 RepID=UPI00129EA985|nr:kinetochore-associated protein NSL1 homolog isoform X2 [Phasianus colchicus]